LNLIFDNIIFSLQKAGGISLYWFELSKRIVNCKYKVESYQFKNNNIFDISFSKTMQAESYIPLSLLRYLPFTRKLTKKCIFHSSYYRVSIQNNVANVTTVHDFTYEYFSSGIKQKIHSWQKNFAIRHSAGIICVSENTKRDLQRFLPDIDPTRIKIIHNGVGDEFFPIESSGKFKDHDLFSSLYDKKYVLFVGDRSPYKNFDKAVETLKHFSDLFLVVVGGKPFSESENKILFGLDGRFSSYQGVSGEALNWLYNNAFCLLYPSSYEGFGIPVLEAMKSGCPVVSSNFSSIPDVAGDAALLVDEITVEQLSKCVASLYDLDFRKGLIDKGFNQANKFSWDKCFEETMGFYEEVWEREFGDNY